MLGTIKTAEENNATKSELSIEHSKQFKRVAIFASGAGSNAEKIIEHFLSHPTIKITLVVCNVPTAGVIQKASAYSLPVLVIEKEEFFKGHHYLPQLQQAQIDFIALAGFLWKVPERLVEAYPNKIVNIHPALLPKYGGKGMYGLKVHEAVIMNNETESGITIHFVDEQYDHGKYIIQARCPVLKTDTPEALAERVHQLEHEHYAATIEGLLQ